MPHIITRFCAILFLMTFSPVSGHLTAQTIYGLSGDKLVAFEAGNPGSLTQTMNITGLIPGQTLTGLDCRPATGQLYALGYNGTTGAADLYTLNRMTGAATRVSSSSFLLGLNIADFGFDFNPTVDRIRLTASDNTNLRLHPVTGVVAATDGNLAFAATDPNAALDQNVGTSAYTNSYIGATSTTLYNFDPVANLLLTQAPPNNGTLNTVAMSNLSLDPADLSVDLDIYFDAVSSVNKAYFIANTTGSSMDGLYEMNLMSGMATPVGGIGGGIALRDIAVLIDRTVPATVTGNLLYALNSLNNLISFDSALPGIVRTLTPVTGVTTGQVISGLDFRPATGELYALGYNNTTGEARLYTLNLMNGAATPVGASAVMLAAGLGKVAMDFNPTVDRIRVTGSNNANYRLHPVTGAIAATDMNLAFSGMNAGTDPSIGAVAYTNSFNGTGTTTLYNYDDSLNVLTTQNPPNNGTLNTVGASGISVNLADPSTDLDIYYDLNTGMNVAYLAANTGTQTADNLYSLNLMTGAATLLGRIGMGIAVTDLAAFLSVPAPETACDESSNGCARFELISVKLDASGNKTYRLRVTNTCASALSYVAFSVPDGVEVRGPVNGSNYAAPSTRSYMVRSPNFSPFYSVRFKPTGAGIANGQSDIFEYKLPRYASLTDVHTYLKLADGSSAEGYLDTYNCPTQPYSGSRVAERTEENDAMPLAIDGREMRVYPNPCTSYLTVELGKQSSTDVRISVLSATGQLLFERIIDAGNDRLRLELPADLSNGLYFLKTWSEGACGETRRFAVHR